MITTTRSDETPRRHGIPRGLRRTGPVLLSYGFRPFFLGAGVFAVLAMALWIAALATGLPLGGGYGAVAWHGHEMLFGFGPAVLAGFLMTAIPNWTGQMPLSGPPLAALVGPVAGRGGWRCSRPAGSACRSAVAVDALFLPALVAVCARELIAGRKWADMKVLGGVALIGRGEHRLPCRGAADRRAPALGAGGGGGLRAAGHHHRRADRAELHPQLAGDAGGRSHPGAVRRPRRPRRSSRASRRSSSGWSAPEGTAAAAAVSAGAGGRLLAAVALARRRDAARAAAPGAACRLRLRRPRLPRHRGGGASAGCRRRARCT